MKKLFLVLVFSLVLGGSAQAKLYHGVDIDHIYETGEWSSKAFIKQVIDDYTLLLQYQKEFDNCPTALPDVFSCYDKVAEKIITNLYVQPAYNMEDYKQLKKALGEAYGLKNCRNKYAWPSGHMCGLDTQSDVSDFLKKYIQDLIDFAKAKMFEYAILDDYK